jgi:hypothetical protein
VEKRQDSTAGCRIEYWRLAGGIAALWGASIRRSRPGAMNSAGLTKAAARTASTKLCSFQLANFLNENRIRGEFMRIFLCGKAEECRIWKLFQCKPDGQAVGQRTQGDSWLTVGVTKATASRAKARLTRGKRGPCLPKVRIFSLSSSHQSLDTCMK